MNKVIMQLWEESERGWGVRPDGCSLHVDTIERNNYVDNIYKKREQDLTIPSEYDKIVGIGVDIFVDDDIFKKIISERSIKIIESDLNNLINMGQIIIKKLE